MGITRMKGGGILSLFDESAGGEEKVDGCSKDNVYGCYVHGIFDKPEVTRTIVRALLARKGYDPDLAKGIDMTAYKEEQYDKLADIIRNNLDMKAIYKIIEKGNEGR